MFCFQFAIGTLMDDYLGWYKNEFKIEKLSFTLLINVFNFSGLIH